MHAGLFGMGIVLGPTFGPTIGGFIIEHFSWPLIFMINVPIGIVATFSLTHLLKRNIKKASIKKECTLIIQVFFFLQQELVVYNMYSKEDKQMIGLAVMQYAFVLYLHAAGLISFIVRELRIKNPAVNLRVMGNRNLAFTTIFTFVAGFGLFTSVFVYPVLAQRVLGFTAYETGLSLLAPSCIAIILMPVIGKLMSKGVSAIPFLVTGLYFICIVCAFNFQMLALMLEWGFLFSVTHSFGRYFNGDAAIDKPGSCWFTAKRLSVRYCIK